MKFEHINKENGGLLFLTDFKESSYKPLFSDSALYKIVLSSRNGSTIFINNKIKVLKKNELLFCKPLSNIEVIDGDQGLVAIAFNKDFYEIQNQNDEILFYWFWYFGVSHPLIMSITDQETTPFNLIFKMFLKDFKNGSDIQYSIRKKIKLLLIYVSQRLKLEDKSPILKMNQLNAAKKFSQLVEAHFIKTERIKRTTSNNYFFQFKRTLTNIFQKTSPIPFSMNASFPSKSVLHKN